jgi:hypothetical protein
MLKIIGTIGAVLLPIAAAPAAVPLLSGTYIYTSQKFCQMGVTVTYSKATSTSGPFVKQVDTPANGPSNTISLDAGTLKFVQTAAGSGSVTQNGFQGTGSPVLLTETGSGISGTDGAPLQTQTKSASTTFSQTATTLSIKDTGGTTAYNIYYGKIAGGVVQNAVFAGLGSNGCVQQYSMTHN